MKVYLSGSFKTHLSCSARPPPCRAPLRRTGTGIRRAVRAAVLTAHASGSLTARLGPAPACPGTAPARPRSLPSVRPALSRARRGEGARRQPRGSPALCGGPEVLPASRRTCGRAEPPAGRLRYEALPRVQRGAGDLRPPSSSGTAGARLQLPARNWAAPALRPGERRWWAESGGKAPRAPLPGSPPAPPSRAAPPGQRSSARPPSHLPRRAGNRLGSGGLGKGGRHHPRARSAATSTAATWDSHAPPQSWVRPCTLPLSSILPSTSSMSVHCTTPQVLIYCLVFKNSPQTSPLKSY